MAKYIPLDAIVAEIERKIYICELVIVDLRSQENKDYYQGKAEAYKDVLSSIDTLEVKEVDLEKETKKWWKERLHLNPENQLWMDAHQSIVFAKHFFELGLKAQKGE